MAPSDSTTYDLYPPSSTYSLSVDSTFASSSSNTCVWSNWSDAWPCWEAPVLKPRMGRWLSAEERRTLDAKDSRVAVASRSRSLSIRAERSVGRVHDRKPRAVVMHQPAWSARRWKSLT